MHNMGEQVHGGAGVVVMTKDDSHSDEVGIYGYESLTNWTV